MKTDLYVLRLQFIPGPPSALAVPLPGPLPVPLPDLAYVNGPDRGVARDARCQCQTTVSPSLRQLQAAPSATPTLLQSCHPLFGTQPNHLQFD